MSEQLDPLEFLRSVLSAAIERGEAISVSDAVRAIESLDRLTPAPSAGDIAWRELEALSPRELEHEVRNFEGIVADIERRRAELDAETEAIRRDEGAFQRAVEKEVQKRLLSMRRKRRREAVKLAQSVSAPPEPRRELAAPEPVSQERPEPPAEQLALPPGPITFDRPRRTGIRAPISPHRRRRLGRF